MTLRTRVADLERRRAPPHESPRHIVVTLIAAKDGRPDRSVEPEELVIDLAPLPRARRRAAR